MAHSSYLSTYRLDNYSPRLHMSVYQPEVLWSGVITATPTNPTMQLEIAYDSPAPTVNWIFGLPGFPCAQVIIRDPITGKRKATTRTRYEALVTDINDSTHLAIREISNATVPVVEDDIFQIVAFHPPDMRVVTDITLYGYSYGFSPDGMINVTQGYDPSPIANTGGHWAGWTGNVYALGSLSYNIDPDMTTSEGFVHRWTALTSNLSYYSGSSTSADPVFTVAPGHGAVNYTLTNGNGQSSHSHAYYIAHDADNPPHEVVLKDYSGDVDRGVSWTVEVINGNVDDETIPEGMIGILWVDDYSGSGSVNLYRTSATNRSHIIGVGYINRVTSELSGEEGFERTTFEIQSPMTRLGNVTSYSQVLEEGTASLDWTKVKTLGFQRAITHWWRYYTTGQEAGIGFYIDNSFDDARYPQIYIQRSDIISQMRQIADARNGRIVSVERGAGLQLQAHPALLELANRP